MSLWDANQREWLQAMGYSLLVLADEDGDTPEATRSSEADGDDRTGNSAGGHHPGQDHDRNPHGNEDGLSPVPVAENPPPTIRSAPTPRRGPTPPAQIENAVQPSESPSRPRTDAAAKAAALEAARAGGAAGRFEGPLWEALLAGTGQSPAIAARTLRELGLDLSALRADPAAKRALWPHLRRLRRGGGE